MDAEDVAMEFFRREAITYDQKIGNWAITDSAVTFLRDLAGPHGHLLEFGVGTGRLALPLAECGLKVTGVDISPEMLAQLAIKDPDGRVQVYEGDMRSIDLGTTFDVVFCAFNTIYGLPNQDEQLVFLRNAARHLANDGTLVLETHVIPISEFANNKKFGPISLGVEHADLVAIMHDPVNQVVNRQDLRFTQAGVNLSLMRLRYIWPAELDLMAKLAGMRQVARYRGWSGEAFDGTGYCVSLYQIDHQISLEAGSTIQVEAHTLDNDGSSASPGDSPARAVDR